MAILAQKGQPTADYYAHNLDPAEEIIEDIKEEKQIDKLPLRPLFDALLILCKNPNVPYVIKPHPPPTMCPM
ncbi:MAG: hypothetical protein H6559_30535 [Lewinellaceae bacterium]|nr:hypothetical protein [Lewinellaceae bacterium]